VRLYFGQWFMAKCTIFNGTRDLCLFLNCSCILEFICSKCTLQIPSGLAQYMGFGSLNIIQNSDKSKGVLISF